MNKILNSSIVFVIGLLLILLSQNTQPVLAQGAFDNLAPHFFKFKYINSPATVLVNQNFTLSGILVSNLPVRSADEVYISISTSDNVWVYGDKIQNMGVFGSQEEKKFAYEMQAVKSGPILISLHVTAIRDRSIIEETVETEIQAISALTSSPEQSSQPMLSFTNVNFPSEIYVNQEFDITMNLVNTGVLPAKNIFVVANLPDQIFMKNNPSISFSEILQNQSKQVKFTMIAKEQKSFDVKFQVFSSNAETKTLPITFTVFDNVVNIALTNLQTTPIQLYPGDTENQIKLGLTNYGGESLQTVTATLGMPIGFYPSWSGSDRAILGILPTAKTFPTIAEQSVTFYLNIDDRVKAGNYDLKLNLQTIDDKIFKINIPVVILNKAKFEVVSLSYTSSGNIGKQYEDSVSPGKTTVLRVTLKNIGNTPAEAIVAQLQTPNDFEGVRSDVHPSFGNVDALGTIYPNQEFHATFFLNVDDTVVPDIYPGTIKINWQQNKFFGDFSQTIPIAINVSQTPIIEQIPYLHLFLVGITVIFVVLYFKSRSQKNTEDPSNAVLDKSTPI